MKGDTFIAISGGFDILHIGHLRLIKDASQFGSIIVFLNTDEWLLRKKGFVFMPFEERKEILQGVHRVQLVIEAKDGDNTVCESIRDWSRLIRYFGNGGDRTVTTTPELDLCLKLGIKPIFGLGGSKIQSSSKLAKNVQGRC